MQFHRSRRTILLLERGKQSSGERTRALNIQYFFLADQREKGHIEVDYCLTKEMWTDPMTKPLQGQDFKQMVDLLMGRNNGKVK